MRRALVSLVACLLGNLAMSGSLWAQETDLISGDCRSYNFVEKFGDALSDEVGTPVFVLRDGAPAYKGQADKEPARTIKFSSGVYVNAVETENEAPTERVRVRLPYEQGEPQFWMNRTDLLCRNSPLVDPETGLERKALIRTKTTQREDGVVQAIRASFVASGDGSTGQQDARELSRFTTYLIYAESKEKYLLGDQFVLSNAEQKLVGWVKKEELIAWNWSIGLRPEIDLKNADGSTGTICGYDDPTDRTNCVPILAGNSWFKTDLRLPVLEITPDYYRVAAASSGFGGAQVKDGKIVVTKEMLASMKVNPGEAAGFNEDKIRSFNQIDVFFLIDGSKSMGPYIDAIRGSGDNEGVVRSIVGAIERRGGGASIRAGFRVFRDSTKQGQTGVDEGYALGDSQCQEDTDETREEERERFESRLETIQTSNEEADDYDENLLAGLDQAALDMYGCPERQKVLFVISDAGYDPDMQKLRGQPALSAFEVSQRLTELEKVTVFFVRPPMRDKGEFKSEKSFADYSESWNEFAKYGLYILGQVLARDTSNDPNIVPENFFVDLEHGARATASMLDKVSSYVGSVARPDVVNDILVDLRGGNALEQIITRLQGDDRNKDVPVLYWNMMKRTACEGDEKACKERIYDGIFDLYVPKNQPIVLEAWMRSDKLFSWRDILEPIINFGSYSLPEQRRALGQAIRNSLATVLSLPAPEDMNEQVGDYMRRSGLIPGPIKTPLLGYTFRQLSDPGALPVCEIDRLNIWLVASSRMLNNVITERLSRYKIDDQARECPNMSDNGKELKVIREAPETYAPGPDPDKYRLGSAFLGEKIFWVPHDYLP